MRAMVPKPSGIRMLHNIITGASHDGTLYGAAHAASGVDLVEVKNREICCDSEWHHHIHYIDPHKELKKRHDY